MDERIPADTNSQMGFLQPESEGQEAEKLFRDSPWDAVFCPSQMHLVLPCWASLRPGCSSHLFTLPFPPVVSHCGFPPKQRLLP